MVNSRFIILAVSFLFAYAMNKQVDSLNNFYFRHTVYLASFYKSLQMVMFFALGGSIVGLDGILTEETYTPTLVILLIVFLIIFICVYSINDRRKKALICLEHGQGDKAEMYKATSKVFETIYFLADFVFSYMFFQTLLFWLSK